MASSKPILISYSRTLDPMASFARNWLEKKMNSKTIERTKKSIQDFCYNNSNEFKKTFTKKIGLKEISDLPLPKSNKTLYKDFLHEICQLDGECVFLLKDTAKLLSDYQQIAGKGFGVVINREFLCDGNEEKYFNLINLFYISLEKAKNLENFQKIYFNNFRAFIKENKHFYRKAKQIHDYICSLCNNQQIIWVDFGFQFTFSLFAYASVKYFSRNSVRQDFYSYTAYTWLQDFFEGKYFSKDNEYGLSFELEGIDFYYQNLKEKSSGAMVGFAIGDSLGFPVAGINKGDIHKFFDSETRDFTSNPKHPFFSKLSPGQYTDNTNLLIISARNIIQNKGFEINLYLKELKNWGVSLRKNSIRKRWAGPTAVKAINKLIGGSDYTTSGSTTTHSCSATYRVIPIGISYQMLSKADPKKIIKLAEVSSMITHNSEISKTGACLVSLIISNLMNSVRPKRAILSAIKLIKISKDNLYLIKRVKEATQMSRIKTITEARKRLGTGSPIYQTLPLSIFFFLKYKTDFSKAVLAAANSYRDDSEEEKERIKKFSWEKQLIEAEGGNTDGIAGLTGAFLGAYIGLSNIPEIYSSIENKKELIFLGQELINKS